MPAYDIDYLARELQLDIGLYLMYDIRRYYRKCNEIEALESSPYFDDTDIPKIEKLKEEKEQCAADVNEDDKLCKDKFNKMQQEFAEDSRMPKIYNDLTKFYNEVLDYKENNTLEAWEDWVELYNKIDNYPGYREEV